MKINKKIIISVIALIIVAGGAFYGGMIYKGNQVPQRGTQGQRNTGNRFSTGANFIAGDVVSKDNQSITIKARDGSSKIIFYSNNTEVSKFIAGDINDVIAGKTVMVNGKTNPDGSITAQSIQIRPAMPSVQGGNNNQ